MSITKLALASSAVLLAACSSSSAPATRSAAPESAPESTSEPSPSPDVAPASLAGIYSEAQAERGADVFTGVCGDCHYTNEFRDQQFKFSWRRRTVADLFGHIKDTMPENAPGSLSTRQYADVVAYILSLNGVPAGSTELPTDVEALDAYSLAGLSGP